jgi:TolB-like protein
MDSIAVLPFRDLSSDTTHEYFSDGLTQELITKLWQVGKLRVRPLSSVMCYKRSDKSLSEIGRELGVQGLIAPTALRVGGVIRITPTLIDVATETILWTKDYERDIKDVFALQSEISQAIVKEVSVKLVPAEQIRLASSYRVNPEAHTAYLIGNLLLENGMPAGAQKALVQFQRAIELDSNFALAYLGYSKAVACLGSDMTQAPEESYPKRLAALTKAIEKDPNLAEAHAALGGLKAYHEYDLEGAEREMRVAVELNPGSADVHGALGFFLAAVGRYDDAILQLKQAMDIDPQNGGWRADLAQIHFFFRRFDEATKILKETLEVTPDDLNSHSLLGYVYLVQGQFTQALSQLEAGRMRSYESMYDRWSYAWLYARMGQRQKAQAYLDTLLECNQEGYFDHTLIGAIYGELHEPDRAFEFLEKAYSRHEASLVSWLKAGPAFDPLRSDPRFVALLKRIGLEQ